jgi:hypothetical protein
LGYRLPSAVTGGLWQWMKRTAEARPEQRSRQTPAHAADRPEERGLPIGGTLLELGLPRQILGLDGANPPQIELRKSSPD